MPQIAAVAWDNFPWTAMESADSVRVPVQDIRMGQHLGLFAYGIACCERLKASHNSLCVSQGFGSSRTAILQRPNR